MTHPIPPEERGRLAGPSLIERSGRMIRLSEEAMGAA